MYSSSLCFSFTDRWLARCGSTNRLTTAMSKHSPTTKTACWNTGRRRRWHRSLLLFRLDDDYFSILSIITQWPALVLPSHSNTPIFCIAARSRLIVLSTSDKTSDISFTDVCSVSSSLLTFPYKHNYLLQPPILLRSMEYWYI